MKRKRVISVIVAASMLMSSASMYAFAGETEAEKVSWREKLAAAASSIQDGAAELIDAASAAAEEAGVNTSDLISAVSDSVMDYLQNASGEIAELNEVLNVSAQELGSITADAAAELMDSLGDAADQSSEVIQEASDFIVDQADGAVQDAEDFATNASDSAAEAFSVLCDQGKELVSIVSDAIAGIDLSDLEVMDTAEALAQTAIEKASEAGTFKKKLDAATVKLLSKLIISAIVYGQQYSNNEITLAEYVVKLSEVIIKTGLPCGVGTLIKLLPIPGADVIAREASLYLIALAENQMDSPETELDPEPETEVQE